MSVDNRDQSKEVTYRCPNCAVTIDVSNEYVGQTLSCPNCEMPFRASAPEAKALESPKGNKEAEDGDYEISKRADTETLIEKTHPAVFRKNPILFSTLAIAFVAASYFLVTSLLAETWWLAILLGVGLVAIAGYVGYRLILMLMTTLRVTNKRTTLRHGIISRRTTEVQHDDIRNMQVDQTIVERLLGIGDIAISSAGQDNLEVDVDAIPRPAKIADKIRQLQP